MLVISADVLRNLRRIPRSSENAAVNVRQALHDNAVLVYFSHRWLNAGNPDDDQGTKCRALLNWCEWYENDYSGQKTSRKLYFWIDWSCLDQDFNDGHKGVQSLPLYVSACNDFLCYETADYADRAWCRVERVIAYTYTFAVKIPWIIHPSFANIEISEIGTPSSAPPNQQITSKIRYKARDWILHGPREGLLSCGAKDWKHIHSLTACALSSKAWTGGDGRVLKFGKSKVMAQVMVVEKT